MNSEQIQKVALLMKFATAKVSVKGVETQLPSLYDTLINVFMDILKMPEELAVSTARDYFTVLCAQILEADESEIGLPTDGFKGLLN